MTNDNIHPSGVYKVPDFKTTYIAELEQKVNTLEQENARLRTPTADTKTQTSLFRTCLNAFEKDWHGISGATSLCALVSIGSGIATGKYVLNQAFESRIPRIFHTLSNGEIVVTSYPGLGTGELAAMYGVAVLCGAMTGVLAGMLFMLGYSSTFHFDECEIM